jgi:hypothetical protein
MNMKILFYLFVFLQLSICSAQQPSVNLIPNPSFEFNTLNGNCPGYLQNLNFGNDYVFDWSEINNWEQPDCINYLVSCISSPLGDAIWLNEICNTIAGNGYGTTNYARTGNSWARISCYLSQDCNYPTANCGDYGYVCSNLLQPLINGHYYYWEFYARPDAFLTPNSYGCSLGMYFTNGRPGQYRTNRLHVTPQANSGQTNSTSYNNGWVKFSGTFYSTNSTYDWVTIGTFDQNAPGYNGFYFLDDVKLIDLGTTNCPQKWLIENTTYSSNQNQLIEAGSFIYSGNNVGLNPGNGLVDVLNNSSVTYKAGQEIGLKDGFSAIGGCTFHAFIAPCGSNCNPPVGTAGNDFAIDCNQNCYQLGSVPQYGLNYSWYPLFPTGDPNLSCLSNTNIANPIFCAPNTPFDEIIYLLVITNNCGDFATDIIYIKPPLLHDISTGVTNGTKDQYGTLDNDWRIVSTPDQQITNLNSFSAKPIVPWLSATSNDANWIVPLIDNNFNPIQYPYNSLNNGGSYTYRYTFNISNISQISAELIIDEIASDNIVYVYLNGNFLFNYLGFNSFSSYTTNNQALFLQGTNALDLIVANTNDWTGVHLKGRIRGHCSSNILRTAPLNYQTNNTLSKESILIYPNPSTGIFTLQKATDAKATVVVYDVLGNQCLSLNINEGEGIKQIDLTNFPKCIYHLQLMEGDKMYSQKIVVQ